MGENITIIFSVFRVSQISLSGSDTVTEIGHQPQHWDRQDQVEAVCEIAL